jgi:hypothetical protein
MGAATKREGIWIVAEFDGHRGVLARVKTKEKTLNPSIKADICSAKGRVEVAECYDFFCPLRPVMMTDAAGRPVMGPDGRPQQGITRDPLITGNHFLLEPAPCYVNFALVSKLMFIDEMTEGDQKNYDSYIKVARDKVEEQVAAIKAASSRIVLPTGGLAAAPLDANGNIDLGKLTRSP